MLRYNQLASNGLSGINGNWRMTITFGGDHADLVDDLDYRQETLNLAASREVSNPNPVKSFAASFGEFDPKGLKKR